jgi:hypothetical protein
MREDRDPRTGERLPSEQRGEASGEQVEWNRPIAAGSTLKPMLARAVERADPLRSRWMILRGQPGDPAACPRGRGAAIYGHCPASNGMWNHAGDLNMVGFLAHSANWFQAAIGLVGTALPDGEIGFGPFGPLPIEVALTRGVGEPSAVARLWTAQRGRKVIYAGSNLDPSALRQTPMWREFEAVIGRQLCRGGNARRCRIDSARRDLCAARALPIANPSPDLRHLVAIGPDHFDFFPEHQSVGEHARVSTLEYMQFLRGSALHPVGSLLQLADAFNRVVFAGDRHAPGSRYGLAASWFPAPVVARPPVTDCGSWRTGDPVQDGLCEVVRSGTASSVLAELLTDAQAPIYGAKTGTIDTLADVAENTAKCMRWRSAHTVAGRSSRPAQQPYWLQCAARAGSEISDSLLLISFGVRTAQGTVLLTLGLRFERSGSGFAAQVARHYLAVVRHYFAPPVAP